MQLSFSHPDLVFKILDKYLVHYPRWNMKPLPTHFYSAHDWKIVDWDVKPQHNNQPLPTHFYSASEFM